MFLTNENLFSNILTSGSGSGGGGTATWGTITGVLASQTDLQNALNLKENIANKGAPNGYAGLDASGNIPNSQLPPEIGDIPANTAARHTQGTDLGLDTGGANPVTAAAIVGHIGDTANPHGVTAAQAGADPAGTAFGLLSTHESTYDHSQLHLQDTDTALDAGQPDEVTAADLRAHLDETDGTGNPHGITAASIGAFTGGSVANEGVAFGDAGGELQSSTNLTFTGGNLNVGSGGGITLFDDDNTNSVNISAPSDITSDYGLVLPASLPAVANQILEFDASGNASFIPTPMPDNASLPAVSPSTVQSQGEGLLVFPAEAMEIVQNCRPVNNPGDVVTMPTAVSALGRWVALINGSTSNSMVVYPSSGESLIWPTSGGVDQPLTIEPRRVMIFVSVGPQRWKVICPFQSTELLDFNSTAPGASEDGFVWAWNDTAGEFQLVPNAGGGGVTGAGVAGRLAYWIGANEIDDDDRLLWDNVNHRLSIGNNPGQNGALGIQNNQGIFWRNVGNDGDYGLRLNNSNQWVFTQPTGVLDVQIFLEESTAVAGGVTYSFESAGSGTSVIRAEGWVEAHETTGFSSNMPTEGSFRLRNDNGVFWRNAANNADYGLQLNNSQYWEFCQPSGENDIRFVGREVTTLAGGTRWEFTDGGSGTAVVRVEGFLEAHEANGFGNVADEGSVRLGNAKGVFWRNAGNTNNHGLYYNNADQFVWHKGDGTNDINFTCNNSTAVAGGTQFNFTDSGSGTAAVRVEGYIEVHETNGFGSVANLPTTGSIRLRNDRAIVGRNVTSNGDLEMMRITNGNRLRLFGSSLWPAADASGYLANDGAGNMSWATSGGIVGGSNIEDLGNVGGVPLDGEILIWNNGAGEYQPGPVPGPSTIGSIGDVDDTGVTNGSGLVWTGSGYEDKFVTTNTQKTRQMYGRISGSGSIQSGSSPGFTITKIGTGAYQINYSNSFANNPVIAANCSVLGRLANANPFATSVGQVNTFQISPGTPSSEDNPFQFIVVGEDDPV